MMAKICETLILNLISFLLRVWLLDLRAQSTTFYTKHKGFHYMHFFYIFFFLVPFIVLILISLLLLT